MLLEENLFVVDPFNETTVCLWDYCYHVIRVHLTTMVHMPHTSLHFMLDSCHFEYGNAVTSAIVIRHTKCVAT